MASRVLSLLILVAVVGGGCVREASTTTYFVRNASDWNLKEAVNPGGASVVPVERSLDWFAEYERFVEGADPGVTQGRSVRLSGHDADLSQLESELEGFELNRTEVRGAPGVVGTGPDGPSIIAFEVDSGYTVMALSYELDVDELSAWAEELEPASEEQWVDGGGRVDS